MSYEDGTESKASDLNLGLCQKLQISSCKGALLGIHFSPIPGSGHGAPTPGVRTVRRSSLSRLQLRFERTTTTPHASPLFRSRSYLRPPPTLNLCHRIGTNTTALLPYTFRCSYVWTGQSSEDNEDGLLYKVLDKAFGSFGN